MLLDTKASAWRKIRHIFEWPLKPSQNLPHFTLIQLAPTRQALLPKASENSKPVQFEKVTCASCAPSRESVAFTWEGKSSSYVVFECPCRSTSMSVCQVRRVNCYENQTS